MGHEESYQGYDNVLKLDYDDGWTTHDIYKTSLNYILEMDEFFNTSIIPHMSENSKIRENVT